MPGLTTLWCSRPTGWLRPFYHSDNKRPSAGDGSSLAPGLTISSIVVKQEPEVAARTTGPELSSSTQDQLCTAKRPDTRGDTQDAGPNQTGPGGPNPVAGYGHSNTPIGGPAPPRNAQNGSAGPHQPCRSNKVWLMRITGCSWSVFHPNSGPAATWSKGEAGPNQRAWSASRGAGYGHSSTAARRALAYWRTSTRRASQSRRPS